MRIKNSYLKNVRRRFIYELDASLRVAQKRLNNAERLYGKGMDRNKVVESVGDQRTAINNFWKDMVKVFDKVRRNIKFEGFK